MMKNKQKLSDSAMFYKRLFNNNKYSMETVLALAPKSVLGSSSSSSLLTFS